VFGSMDYNTGLLSWAFEVSRPVPLGGAPQMAFSGYGLHNGASTVKPTSVPQWLR
jgi:hypothetical protein